MDIRYFDNAATTKISKEVLEEMMPYLTNEYGNPSSMYTLGRNSRRAVEEARKKVANLINCNPEEIIFTSSGTESDNTAIKGLAYENYRRGRHIITSKIEHPAILNTCYTLEKQGFFVTYLDVNKEGLIDINQLIRSIRFDTILISIMFANNEIGTIQEIEEISRISKMYNITFHTDAVQACGNIPIDVKKIGIDMLSLSGHKFHAPKGIGALYVKNGISFKKYMDGGHQEKDKRASTENVASIVGLGKASELAFNNLNKHMSNLSDLRNYFISEVKNKIQGSILNGSIKRRLPGNSNFSFEGIDGEALLLKLDEKEICASSGSACSSGNSNPSHVLKAIGLSDELANGTIRITFGDDNTKEDVDYLVDNLHQSINSLRILNSPELQ